MQLTEDEKSRFRLEEEFRANLRQEFDTPKKASLLKVIWTIANSALVLLLISSVGISYLTNAYAEDRERRAEEKRRQDLIGKLDLEIADRLQYVARTWSSGASNLSDSLQRQRRARIIVSLMRPDSADFPIGVFPELSVRTLPSLIWELRRELVDSAGKKNAPEAAAEAKDLDKALSVSQGLLGIYIEIREMRSCSSDSGGSDASRGAGGAQLLQLMRCIWAFTPEALRKFALERGDVFRGLNLARWGCPFSSDQQAKAGSPDPTAEKDLQPVQERNNVVCLE